MESQASKAKRIYVSYSRRSDYHFIQCLIQKIQVNLHAVSLRSLVLDNENKPAVIDLSQDKEDNNKTVDQWSVCYDQNAMETFGSIKAFMEELSEAEKIIILLTEDYFRSPYCIIELLHIYRKRADNLIPIVVFSGELRASNLKVKEIVDYWRDPFEGGVDALLRQQFHDALPVALAWLLGGYNEETQGWDTVFPNFNFKADNEDEQGAVLAKVVEALNEEKVLRFRIVSKEKRIQTVKEEIKKILNQPVFQTEFGRLKLSSGDADPGPFSGIDNNIFSGNAEFLVRCLETIQCWLEEELKAVKPTRQRDLLLGELKKLIGWLLCLAVNDEALHVLVHALNREGVHAEIPLMEEHESALQLIVSAIAHAQVMYDYVTEDDRSRLRGRGELTLKAEAGINYSNYYKNFNNELNWENSLTSAVHRSLRGRDDYFLRFERAEVEMKMMQQLRKRFGEEYPFLQQVIVDDENDDYAEQKYYCDGLQGGDLDQLVRNIYGAIHDTMKNEKDHL
ncbi:MAG: toll/interleukin-1 receptor domain-containing protein [Gammaproteobacteria bacterium]